MSRSLRALLVVVLLTSAASRADQHPQAISTDKDRATCETLAATKQMKKGLTVDKCISLLQEAHEATDVATMERTTSVQATAGSSPASADGAASGLALLVAVIVIVGALVAFFGFSARRKQTQQNGIAQDVLRPTQHVPFSTARTTAERREWLSHADEWNRLHPVVADELVAKLDGDPAIFEVFVYTSMRAGLVSHYAAIDVSRFKGICASIIGAMLTKVGVPLAQENLQTVEMYRMRGHPPPEDEIERLGQSGAFAVDALECAVALDHNLVPAYLFLALLLGNVRDLQRALRFANAGIEAAKRMGNGSGHLSSLESVRRGAEESRKMEVTLIELSRTLSAQIAAG